MKKFSYKTCDCMMCKALQHIEILKAKDFNWISNDIDAEEFEDYYSLNLEYQRQQLIDILSQIEPFYLEEENGIKYLHF